MISSYLARIARCLLLTEERKILPHGMIRNLQLRAAELVSRGTLLALADEVIE